MREAGGAVSLMSDQFTIVETYSLCGMYQLKVLRVVIVVYLIKLLYTLFKLAMGRSFGNNYYTAYQLTGNYNASYSFMQLLDILLNLIIYQFYQVALLLQIYEWITQMILLDTQKFHSSQESVLEGTPDEGDPEMKHK